LTKAPFVVENNRVFRRRRYSVMSENLTREELERRIEELEKTLERISAQEAASGSRLDKLSKLAGIDLALRCSPRRDIVLWEVLGRVLEIFDCDRAWLLSPCDPAAASWSVRMERTVPEYPGAMEQAGEIGMTPDMAEMFRRALAASAPVAYGPGGLPLAESTKNWRVQSHLSMALRTNTGAPWQFGLHQCSYPRSWSPEEKDLFRKIGYRITATLNLLHLAASARREDLSVDSAPDDMRTVSARDETLRLLEAQATLGQKLAASRSLQASLDTCLRSAIETTGMDAGGIYLFGDGGEATLEAQMNLSPEFAGRVARESLNTPLGRRVAGGAGLFLTPADVPERLRKILEDEGIVSLGVIPIASEGRLIGCMNIASKTNEKIDEKIRHALEVVAQTAGSAIERIRAGEQLRLTHASLLALVEHADDHIAIYDHEGGPVLWNRAYADIVKELLGIDVKQGIKPHTLLKDPAAVAWWEELHRRVLGGEGFRVEYEHGEGTGARYFEVSYSPIIEEGQVKGFAEVTREITDRRKAEDALRESEERSRNLVSNLALGVSRLAPDGTILYSNPSHDRTFGYDPGELQRKQRSISGNSLGGMPPSHPGQAPACAGTAARSTSGLTGHTAKTPWGK
jgi:PAS domain S-box-containing protein